MTISNKFDSSNYPDSEPSELFAGERWAWTRSDITAAYPTASYTLKYLLTLQTSVGTQVTITATKSASAHVVEVGQATTDAYTAGTYNWQAIVVRDSDSEEVVVDEGFIEVGAQTGDIRSHTLTVLQAIRATIEGTASNEQSSYSIAGRSLSRRTIDELMTLEAAYSRRWAQEKAATDRKAGRAKSNRVIVRMNA